MQTEAQKQHEWLQKLVGEWTYEAEMQGEPGKPAEKLTGTESVRSIGGLWVMCEGRGTMPGGAPATMIITLGYDPAKQRFVGTWIGSMMTYLWLYNGSLDAAERVLTLSSEGPDMSTEGKMAQYQDIIEMESDDRRTLTARVLGDDGQWRQLMKMYYRKTAR